MPPPAPGHQGERAARDRLRLALVAARPPCRPAPLLHWRAGASNTAAGWTRRSFIQEPIPRSCSARPATRRICGFATELAATDGTALARLWLHTSPEFALKKLLAAGEERLYAFARVFRNRERRAFAPSRIHHAQAWYRAGATYEALMADCAELLATAAVAAGTRRLAWRGQEVDPRAPFERVTLAEAFAHHAGIDLLASVAADGSTDRDHLAAGLRAAGMRVAADDGWSDLFSRVLVERIEPRPGQPGTRATAWPTSVAEAALAASRAIRAWPSASRLYACGVEPRGRRADRSDRAAPALRAGDGGEGAHLLASATRSTRISWHGTRDHAAASGIALGFDRLVMLASGA
ncbi:MAG: EF-P lysine aminoacylase GenX [Geminicoccaceae bacterium]